MSEDNKNPHAALIEQYCRDWQETDKPWIRWQIYSGEGYEWRQLADHPTWSPGCQYRRKPDTIVVNGIDVNAPLKVAPKLGMLYWTVSVEGGVIRSTWDDDKIDQNRLKNGCACATEVDAKALWNAMTAPLRAYVNGGGK